MVHIHVGDLDWQFPCQAWQTSDSLLCPWHSFVPPQMWETQLQFLPCTLMTKKDSTFKFGQYGLFKRQCLFYLSCGLGVSRVRFFDTTYSRHRICCHFICQACFQHATQAFRWPMLAFKPVQSCVRFKNHLSISK